MLKEDIQPGYAPKEISFGGYTTKNLHHSADAAKAFQETIQKAYNGEIKRPDLIRTALEHTDQYMKMNDMHLEQSKSPDEQELTQWKHAHEKAREALGQIGEFTHHEDYWHNHQHELEDMLGDYNPETAGAEMSDSYNPEGDMIKEELTDKTIRAGDKIKVARVIADMLGVENAEKLSPDAAVNAGLTKVKNKRLTPEFASTLHKMIALAQEVGIKVTVKIPALATEEADSPVVDKKSKYNAAKGILRFNDFAKLSKLNQGVVPVQEKNEEEEQKVQLAPGQEPEAPNTKMNDKGVGFTMGDHGQEHKRRMKIRYRTEEVEVKEDVESADYKTSRSGRKYHAHHITFHNSGRDATLNQDEDQEQKKPATKAAKPLLKKIGEEAEHDDYEFSEKELEDLAKSVDTEEDLEDVYDGEEFEIVDDETGEPVEDEKEDMKEEVLNEVMSRMARLRARTRFLQTKTKRARRLKIALKTHSNTQTINRRARKLAINLMKQRILRKPVSQFTVAEKERVEKIMSKRGAAIGRLAMKLVPRIRKIEQARFAHTKFTKSAPSAAM